MSEQGWHSPSSRPETRGSVLLRKIRRIIALSSDRGALTLALPSGWRPLRGWVLLFAALAALNIAAYAALTRPRWFDVTARSRALEAARQARQLLEPALAEARANYGLVLQAETDLENLKTRISSAGGVSSVISSLGQRLEAVGMHFDRGTYARERIDELDLLLLQMAVPLSGRYAVVRELVESLAAGDGFMTIDQVGLVNPDQAGSGGSLQVELQLAAFLPGTISSLPSASEDEPAPTEEVDPEAATPIEDADAEAAAPAEEPDMEDAALTDAMLDLVPAEEPEAALGEEPDPANEENASAVTTSQAEREIAKQTTRPTARPVSEVSPVRRAGELQAQLASLPPLPYPPEAYDVRLDDLDAARDVSEAPGRNLFDFVRRQRPTAVDEPRTANQGGGEGQQQGQGARQVQATPSRPSISLRLLGIVRVGAVRYASLTDGTELHVAAAGSSLPGGYQILEVGIDYAEIKLGEQQVRLTLES